MSESFISLGIKKWWFPNSLIPSAFIKQHSSVTVSPSLFPTQQPHHDGPWHFVHLMHCNWSKALLSLMFKLSQICPVRAPSSWFFCLLDIISFVLESFLFFWHKMSYAHLVLSCPNWNQLCLQGALAASNGEWHLEPRSRH